MSRGRLASIVLMLLTFVGAAPAHAQSFDDGTTAPDQGAAQPDENGWFDETQEQGAFPQEGSAPADYAAPSDSSAAQPAPPADDADPRALTEFRPTLDPYGTWIEDPRYGTVWVPRPSVVGDNFSPYVTGGHWALSTSNEWVWVSDYPFGWVVYHYGRWVWIPGTGWAWIPGYRYAPAWVTWRVPTGAYDYVGWAPYPPDYIWVGGVAVGFYAASTYYWAFCPSPYVFHTHVNYYVVRDRGLVTRLGYYSRPYVSAAPRYRVPAQQARYRVPASPPPRVARVPAHAVPRERVAARPAPRSIARVNGVQRDYAGSVTAGPSRTRVDVGRSRAPNTDRRAVVPSSSPSPARDTTRATRPPQVSPQRSVAPERSKVLRPSPQAAPRTLAPRPKVAPRQKLAPRPQLSPRSERLQAAPPARMAPRPQAAPRAPGFTRPQMARPEAAPRGLSPRPQIVPRSQLAPRPQAAPRAVAPRPQAAPQRSFSRPAPRGISRGVNRSPATGRSKR